jgi:hypothetical protein
MEKRMATRSHGPFARHLNEGVLERHYLGEFAEFDALCRHSLALAMMFPLHKHGGIRCSFVADSYPKVVVAATAVNRAI